jgi:hypothetical protein
MIQKDIMGYNNRIKNVISILKYAIENDTSLTKASINLNFSSDFIFDFKRRHNKNNYTPELYNEYENLSQKYYNKDKNLTSNVKNLNIDDKFDARSTCGENRDENGKIINYWFTILIRDELPFTGTLSREQMENIYQNYPYVTSNTCSSLFPYLTFIQFRRVLRVFNITKEQLFPKHIIEEHTEEEIANFALKAKSHASYKKFVEQRPITLEKELKETQKELFELKENKQWISDCIKEYLTEEKEKIKINYNTNDNDKGLFIYLSDMHIGASNDNNQYDSIYNFEILSERIKLILNEIFRLRDIYGKFESVYVVNLGDHLDGFNGETTRGGHHLPQNMNNKEQFKTYLDIMIWFFNELYSIEISNNINFVSVGDDNHSGDFGYTANLALKYLFEYKFENLNFVLFDKYIEHITYGNHTLIYSHGKDKHNMKNNLPLHLDAKTDTYFINYMKMNKIKTDSCLVVKGDLHQYTTQMGKNFRYTNIPSIYGSSGWIEANFGYTQPAFVYQIIDKSNINVLEGYLGLD